MAKSTARQYNNLKNAYKRLQRQQRPGPGAASDDPRGTLSSNELDVSLPEPEGTEVQLARDAEAEASGGAGGPGPPAAAGPRQSGALSALISSMGQPASMAAAAAASAPRPRSTAAHPGPPQRHSGAQGRSEDAERAVDLQETPASAPPQAVTRAGGTPERQTGAQGHPGDAEGPVDSQETMASPPQAVEWTDGSAAWQTGAQGRLQDAEGPVDSQETLASPPPDSAAALSEPELDSAVAAATTVAAAGGSTSAGTLGTAPAAAAGAAGTAAGAWHSHWPAQPEQEQRPSWQLPAGAHGSGRALPLLPTRQAPLAAGSAPLDTGRGRPESDQAAEAVGQGQQSSRQSPSAKRPRQAEVHQQQMPQEPRQPRPPPAVPSGKWRTKRKPGPDEFDEPVQLRQPLRLKPPAQPAAAAAAAAAQAGGRGPTAPVGWQGQEQQQQQRQAPPPGGYKYQDVVRKKAEREQLQGFECPDCQRFYDAVRSWGYDAAPEHARRCHHAGVWLGLRVGPSGPAWVWTSLGVGPSRAAFTASSLGQLSLFVCLVQGPMMLHPVLTSCVSWPPGTATASSPPAPPPGTGTLTSPSARERSRGISRHRSSRARGGDSDIHSSRVAGSGTLVTPPRSHTSSALGVCILPGNTYSL